jgi:hypothetical protein
LNHKENQNLPRRHGDTEKTKKEKKLAADCADGRRSGKVGETKTFETRRKRGSGGARKIRESESKCRGRTRVGRGSSYLHRNRSGNGDEMGTRLSRELPDAAWADERLPGSFHSRSLAKARTRSIRMTKKSRNMSRYPIVLKDYGIPSYFVRRFRYNEQALVYSGLLACNAGLASKHAAYAAGSERVTCGKPAGYPAGNKRLTG